MQVRISRFFWEYRIGNDPKNIWGAVGSDTLRGHKRQILIETMPKASQPGAGG